MCEVEFPEVMFLRSQWVVPSFICSCLAWHAPHFKVAKQKVKKSVVSLTLSQKDVDDSKSVRPGVKSTRGAEGGKVMMEGKGVRRKDEVGLKEE